MKPLERIFFVACINTLIATEKLLKPIHTRDMVRVFVLFGFNEKQLWYYVEKWSDKGFYEYGVSPRFGWFLLDKLTGEYKVLYEKYKKER